MRISLLISATALLAGHLCLQSHLGAEYAHFASAPALSGEEFLSMTDGFFSSWHGLDLSGGQELKAAHLEAIRAGIDERIRATPDIGLADSNSAEFKLLQARLLLSSPEESLRNFNHFASKQGLSGVFGRALDGQELLSAFQAHLTAFPEYYASEVKAELDGRNAHLSAETSDLFFSGETGLESLRHFLAFSLAHLERASDEYSHLALGLPSDFAPEASRLTDTMLYLNNAGAESDWETIEHHLLGAANEAGDRLEPPMALGFYHALSVAAQQGGFEKGHLLFGKSKDEAVNEQSPFFKAATEKYKPQAGVVVQPITVDFSNLVLDLNDASSAYKLPGKNIAVGP